MRGANEENDWHAEQTEKSSMQDISETLQAVTGQYQMFGMKQELVRIYYLMYDEKGKRKSRKGVQKNLTLTHMIINEFEYR